MGNHASQSKNTTWRVLLAAMRQRRLCRAGVSQMQIRQTMNTIKTYIEVVCFIAIAILDDLVNGE